MISCLCLYVYCEMRSHLLVFEKMIHLINDAECLMEIDDDIFVTVIQLIHCRNAVIPSTWRPAKRMYIIDLLAQIKTLKESEDFTIVSYADDVI